MKRREASALAESGSVRCEVSVALLCRLLRGGDLVAADLACLDAASALALRRCVLDSCRSGHEGSQRCAARAACSRR